MAEDRPDLADKLVAKIASYESCLIAFSGGVDSAVVLRAASEALRDRAVAGLGVGPSLSAVARLQAERVAAEVGCELVCVETDEWRRPDYQENSGERCRACKETLYSTLRRVADARGLSVLASGTNFDDLSDYRPGLLAGQAASVCTPLADLGIGKAMVRELARRWGLSVSEAPAGPCLASRIAYGEPVTPEKLRQVEAAEAWFHRRGFREVRVRLHPGGHARVEVGVDQLPQLVASPDREAAVAMLRDLGFRFVSLDLEGFASGRLNRLVSLQAADPRQAIQIDEL